MPFEEEELDLSEVKATKLKNISPQKSMFDTSGDKKTPTPQMFEEAVNKINKKSNDYKATAAELAVAYKKILQDKTLVQNRNVFNDEAEKDVLTRMINLAVEINTDENEQEGMGSLGWITLLLKSALYHRDRINHLEYSLIQLQKNIEEQKKQINNLLALQELDSAEKNK